MAVSSVGHWPPQLGLVLLLQQSLPAQLPQIQMSTSLVMLPATKISSYIVSLGKLKHLTPRSQYNPWKGWGVFNKDCKTYSHNCLCTALLYSNLYLLCTGQRLHIDNLKRAKSGATGCPLTSPFPGRRSMPPWGNTFLFVILPRRITS